MCSWILHAVNLFLYNFAYIFFSFASYRVCSLVSLLLILIVCDLCSDLCGPHSVCTRARACVCVCAISILINQVVHCTRSVSIQLLRMLIHLCKHFVFECWFSDLSQVNSNKTANTPVSLVNSANIKRKSSDKLNLISDRKANHLKKKLPRTFYLTTNRLPFLFATFAEWENSASAL